MTTTLEERSGRHAPPPKTSSGAARQLPHDLLDLLERVQREKNERTLQETILVERLGGFVDLVRGAARVREDEARFVGRYDALAARQQASAPRTVSVREAAERLGCIKADGKVSDRFYNTIAPRIGQKEGGKWLPFHVDRIEALERGEL